MYKYIQNLTTSTVTTLVLVPILSFSLVNYCNYLLSAQPLPH